MEGKIQVNSGDVSIIAVNVDGKTQTTIPRKDEGKSFQKADCTNGAAGSWDRSNWRFLLSGLNETKTKCTLYFVTGSVTGEQSGENKMEELLAKETTSSETLGTIIKDDFGNIRYIGSSPNNWVTFNGEKWRIIGLMDGIQTKDHGTQRLLKIIRKDKLSKNLSWDSSSTSVNYGYGVNEWNEADLQKELNNETNGYLNTVKQTDSACFTGRDNEKGECPDWSAEGLTTNAKNMIEEVVWNIGTADTTSWDSSNVTPLQYIWERSTNNGKQCSGGDYCNDEVDRQTTWTGKVGLMYPSDYGYATDGGSDLIKRGQCLYTPLYKWGDAIYSYCKNNDWLFDSSSYQWTMTPALGSSGAYFVFIVFAVGNVRNDIANYAGAVRPVVYLKSSVKITGGTGEESNPYQLKLG